MERLNIYRPIDDWLNQFILVGKEKDLAEYLVQTTLKGHEISHEMDINKSEFHRLSSNIFASVGVDNRLMMIARYAQFLEDKLYAFRDGETPRKWYNKAQ